VVKKGLKQGEIIASTGVFKLNNGANIIVNNSVVPNFSIEPSVSDE